MAEESEQFKFNNLMDHLLSKVLHPDIYDRIIMQMNRANAEYREQVMNEAS